MKIKASEIAKVIADLEKTHEVLRVNNYSNYCSSGDVRKSITNAQKLLYGVLSECETHIKCDK